MSWTEPPWSGWIATTGDALIMLEAARRGVIPRVTRRLVDAERKMICSGSVFVFDEDESGIKRWTDGLFWSPSRILGNFLLYRETDKRGAGHRRADPKRKKSDGAIGDRNEGAKSDEGGPNEEDEGLEQQPGPSSTGDTSLARPKGEMPKSTTERNRERTLVGSLTNSYKFKPNGLMKKTFSLTIAGVSQHLISYYSPADVESGRLRAPSSIPELASLEIAPEYLDKTHFRIPPRIEIDRTGRPRYIGEADDDVPIDALGGLGGGLSGAGVGQSTARSLLHDVPLLPLQDVSSSAIVTASRRQKRGDPYPTSPVPRKARRRTNPEDGPSPPSTAIGTTGLSTNTLGGAGSSPEDSTFGVYTTVPPTSAPGTSGAGGSGAYTYGYPPSYGHYTPHHATHHSQGHGHGHAGHHVGQPNSAPVGGSFDTASVYGLGDTVGVGVTGTSSSYGPSSFAGSSTSGAGGNASNYANPYGWTGGGYGSPYTTGPPSTGVGATPRGAQGQGQGQGQAPGGGVSVALNPVHGHGAAQHGMYGMADERRR